MQSLLLPCQNPLLSKYLPYHCTVSFNPSSRLYFGFHPSTFLAFALARYCLSISFFVVPRILNAAFGFPHAAAILPNSCTTLTGVSVPKLNAPPCTSLRCRFSASIRYPAAASSTYM